MGSARTRWPPGCYEPRRCHRNTTSRIHAGFFFYGPADLRGDPHPVTCQGMSFTNDCTVQEASLRPLDGTKFARFLMLCPGSSNALVILQGRWRGCASWLPWVGNSLPIPDGQNHEHEPRGGKRTRQRCGPKSDTLPNTKDDPSRREFLQTTLVGGAAVAGTLLPLNTAPNAEAEPAAQQSRKPFL